MNFRKKAPRFNTGDEVVVVSSKMTRHTAGYIGVIIEYEPSYSKWRVKFSGGWQGWYNHYELRKSITGK